MSTHNELMNYLPDTKSVENRISKKSVNGMDFSSQILGCYFTKQNIGIETVKRHEMYTII